MPKFLKIVIVLILASSTVFIGGRLIFMLGAVAAAIMTIMWIVGRGYFWKAYFVFYILMVAASFFIEDGQSNYPVVLGIAGFFIEAVGAIGLFGYAFKKKIFKTIFWQIWFLLLIANFISYVLFSFQEMASDPDLGLYGAPFVIVFMAVILYPYFYALYKYAFEFEEVNKNEDINNEIQ